MAAPAGPNSQPNPAKRKYPSDGPSSQVGQIFQRCSLIPCGTNIPAMVQHPVQGCQPVRWATVPNVCTINPALSVDPCDGLQSPTQAPSTQRSTLTRTMGYIPKRVYINPALSVDPCDGLQSPTLLPVDFTQKLGRAL